MGNRDQHQDPDMGMRNRPEDDASEQGHQTRSGGETGQGSTMGQGTPSAQGDSGVMGGESWQDQGRQGSRSEDDGDTSTASRDEQTSRS
jgi:hypothetical protein